MLFYACKKRFIYNKFYDHMNNENYDNELKINEYIKNNPNCKLHKTISVMLNGKLVDLEAFRLPLEYTFYNIKNGRFAAEYIDLVKQEGKELKSNNPTDSKKIQSLLIDLDPKQSLILLKDLQAYGQKDPGIITYDGQVINGNRRKAVLEELVEDGHSQFKFIEVTRLPQNVSAQDLWKIEAGIQLSRNVQLNYGPINELLKFQQGIQAGLTPLEIANSLYGGFRDSEILEKLEILKLITEYLKFIGAPGIFNRAKGVHEHFIDLRNIILGFKKQGALPDEIVVAKHIGFQLIHDGVAQRDMRKIKQILAYEKVKNKFWDAIEYSKPGNLEEKLKKKIDAEQNDEYTPARTIFNNCLDSLRAISEAQQPEKLLNRALTNLENINVEKKSLAKPEIQSLIKEIEKVIDRLKS